MEAMDILTLKTIILSFSKLLIDFLTLLSFDAVLAGISG